MCRQVRRARYICVTSGYNWHGGHGRRTASCFNFLERAIEPNYSIDDRALVLDLFTHSRFSVFFIFPLFFSFSCPILSLQYVGSSNRIIFSMEIRVCPPIFFQLLCARVLHRMYRRSSFASFARYAIFFFPSRTDNIRNYSVVFLSFSN